MDNLVFTQRDFIYNEYLMKFMEYRPYHYVPTPEFLDWFLGYFEGRGKFIFRKNLIAVELRAQDERFIVYLHSKINVGTIRAISLKKGIYRWQTKKVREVYLLCLLFNGNLVFPENALKFKAYLEKVHKSLFFKNEKRIKFNRECVLPKFNNGWFSGYTDSRGMFYVWFPTTSNTIYKIAIRFFQDLENNTLILKYLSHTLRSTYGENVFKSEVKRINKKVWAICIDDLKSSECLISYYNEYPLRSKRVLKYALFVETIREINNNNHVLPEVRERYRGAYKKILKLK